MLVSCLKYITISCLKLNRKVHFIPLTHLHMLHVVYTTINKKFLKFSKIIRIPYLSNAYAYFE